MTQYNKTAIPRAELVDKSFGDLTVKEYVGNNKHSQSLWRCVCSCGNEVIVCIVHLKNGHTRSCGCLRKRISETLKSANIKTGKFTCSKCKLRKLLKERARGARNYRCMSCDKIYKNDHYSLNSEKYKIASAKWRKTHQEQVKQVAFESKRNNPEKYLLSLAKRRAKEKGLEFSISVTDIVIPKVCPVLGIKLEKVPSGTRTQLPGTPTIDRLNPKKGYTKDNVKIISWRANSLKGDGSLAEFQSLVEWLKKGK